MEDEGEVITDGRETLARLQVKTEKLVQYTHQLEFFSGIKLKVKPDALWSARNLGVFNESNELVGSVRPSGDTKKAWLEMHDKFLLKNKYSFEVNGGSWNKSIVIRNEAGTVVAQLMRKFLWKKLRNRLFIVEENADNLVFEDRLLIYTLAHVSRKVIP